MSSISSISKMVSGLNAAQTGLQVTGHNIANTNTQGFTRQQLLQHETGYINIGERGGHTMQVGLGVSATEIRQIRDELADKRLRTESSVLNYYKALSTTMGEIEAAFSEPYGDTISDALNSFWSQAQKLNTAPDGVEERLSFISTAKVLVGKINDVSNTFIQYQDKLNKEVEGSVKEINSLIQQIRSVNEDIAKVEQAGHDGRGNYYKNENANDYRDKRNLLLDELSTYGNIDYYEEPDGRVLVKFENHIVVNKQFINTLELTSTDPVNGSPYNKPIWSDTRDDVYDMKEVMSSENGNDGGSLKGLLIARGENIVNDKTTWDDVALNDSYSVDKQGNSYLIPKVQMMLNTFTDRLVELVNDSFDGTGIGTELGQAGVPVFTVIDTSLGLVPGNIQVNPELLEQGGYNKLGTVSGDINNTGSNQKVTEFLKKWEERTPWFNGGGATSPYEKRSNITDFFSEFVTEVGTEGSLYIAKVKEKNTAVLNIENERMSMSGVSQDEEFSNMLRYQYAYNASARMITMLDGMLDVIVNKL